MITNIKHLRNALKKEGFRRVYVWEDKASGYYEEHCHSYKKHTAHVGINGCIYLAGERP